MKKTGFALLGVMFLGAACGQVLVPNETEAGRVGASGPNAQDVEGLVWSPFGGGLVADADELLVIERGDAPPSGGFFSDDGSDGDVRGRVEDLYSDHSADLLDTARRSAPGTGGLVTEIDERTVVVPLTHTGVQGEVRGNVASLAVTQQFANPFDHPIEAVYVFPLPHDAAVTDFLMTIGERTIRGVVREREEAEKLYAEARRQGITASLLTQERPNVFTQQVANIAPGGAIDVSIEYFNRLRYLDGWYEFVFPMVVGPRYNPAGSTEGIGAVTLATRGSSGQATEVPYLRPGERSGHDIDLALELFAGAPIEELACDTHQLEIERPAADRANLKLAHFDRLPNRDLVLRYRVAGDRVRTTLHAHQSVDQGWLHLTILPPALLTHLPARPMEMIFVVDTSGSMEGAPLRQAKAAILDALARLDDGDTFRVIRFSNGASELDADPLAATPTNLERGRRYVAGLHADGGTEMMTGLRAALRQRADPVRQRLVTFLTDGYIGNEDEILREVQASVGHARIFSFGVGTSTNRHLLEAMAREGRGTAAFLGQEDDSAAVMARHFERVRRPALTELAVDWGGLPVSGVYPEDLPDLFVGRPVELVARLSEPVDLRDAAVRVVGRGGDAYLDLPVAVEATGPGPGGRALAKLWARHKIADLGSRARGKGGEQPESYGRRIQEVALEYGLMSAHTAFIAVDSLSQVDGELETIPVSVPVPEGVNFDTTVNDDERSGRR